MARGAGHVAPPMPPSQYPSTGSKSSNTGVILGVIVGVVLLLGVGFAGVLYMNRGEAEGTAAAAGTPPPTMTRGALTLQTTPSDVSVAVDGAAVGGESPFVVSNLEAGKHRLNITREGYMPIEREVDVGEGGLNLQFSLQRKDVTLILESEPPGASMNLVVDGKPVPMGDGGGQYELSRQAGAKYEVEAKLDGYITQRVPLDFAGEATQKIEITLPREGGAKAEAEPEPQTERDEGRRSSKSSRRARRRPSSSPPRSRPDPDPEPAPPAPAAKTATLRIGTNSGVPPAEVYVDGRRVGKTPLPSVKVTPGRHRVKYKWPDGKEVSQTVDVADGGSKVVKGG